MCEVEKETEVVTCSEK